jgi:hypothetical protein
MNKGIDSLRPGSIVEIVSPDGFRVPCPVRRYAGYNGGYVFERLDDPDCRIILQSYCMHTQTHIDARVRVILEVQSNDR